MTTTTLNESICTTCFEPIAREAAPNEWGHETTSTNQCEDEGGTAAPLPDGMTAYEVEYEIVTGIDDTTIGGGECAVVAADEDGAHDAALAWIEENDYRVDSRVDPNVRIGPICEIG